MFYCKNCGKDISYKPSNRRSFCNYKCYVEWTRSEPGPLKKREVRECKECGKTFSCVHSDEKKFCSSSCSAKSCNRNRNYDPKSISEKIKKAYRDGKLTGLSKGTAASWLPINRGSRTKCCGGERIVLIEKQCPVCGKKYIAPKYRRKYCSKECCYKRPGQGGYHAGSVRNFKSGWYTSPIAGRVWMDSSYEFIVAEYLDGKNYKWVKNTKGFPYRKIEDGIERDAHYVPDFYIEDLDLWVETKGYFVENDQRKLDAFPYKIKLITKKTIYDKTTWGF
jgi:hypothetical protein